MVRLLLDDKVALWRDTDEFQSHNGAIAAESVPSATQVAMFQSHNGAIAAGR